MGWNAGNPAIARDGRDRLRPTEDQRQNATQQPGPGVANGPRQATFGVPPRPDNMRVPSRPRGEMGPREESEVAANVFASMLGVASSAPNYPAPSSQSQSPYQQPGAPGNLAQPYMAPPTNQSGMPSPGNYAGPGMGTIPNTPNIPPNMPQGYTPGNSYGRSYQSGTSGSPSSAGMAYAPNSTASTPAQRAADAANDQKKAKKRGLFGAILEWLTH